MRYNALKIIPVLALTMNSTEMTTGRILNPSRAIDISLAVIYIIISIVGVLGNTSAIAFYHQDRSASKRKEFFRILFLLIAYVDLVTCATLAPVIEVMLTNYRGKQPMIFDKNWFCSFWGIIWQINPLISVFLLATISWSRIMTLLFPLKELVDKKVLIVIISVYISYTALVKIVPLVDEDVKYVYYLSMGYCTLEAAPNYGMYLMVCLTNVIQLAFPFVPICVSCLYSIALVHHKRKNNPKKTGSTQRMLENATLTIIIMTVTYLLFNIPVFVNFIQYLRYISERTGTNYYDYYGTVFLNNYAWNLTWLFCTAGNAVCNPLVYIWRMTSYRRCVTGLMGGSPVPPSAATASRRTAGL